MATTKLEYFIQSWLTFVHQFSDNSLILARDIYVNLHNSKKVLLWTGGQGRKCTFLHFTLENYELMNRQTDQGTCRVAFPPNKKRLANWTNADGPKKLKAPYRVAWLGLKITLNSTETGPIDRRMSTWLNKKKVWVDREQARYTAT